MFPWKSRKGQHFLVRLVEPSFTIILVGGEKKSSSKKEFHHFFSNGGVPTSRFFFEALENQSSKPQMDDSQHVIFCGSKDCYTECCGVPFCNRIFAGPTWKNTEAEFGMFFVSIYSRISIWYMFH